MNSIHAADTLRASFEEPDSGDENVLTSDGVRIRRMWVRVEIWVVRERDLQTYQDVDV